MTPPAPIDIFISYRRTDTKAIARLIFEELCTRFGRHHVFFDVDRDEGGADHHQDLSEQVARCSVVLVIIGDRWADGPRAFADDDLVRIEVRTALEMGIPILPILAEGAAFPQATDALDLLHPLQRRDALPVDSGRDFALHMVAVCRQIERMFREYRVPGSPREEGRSGIPSTLSNAPVATATLAPIDRSTSGAGRRLLFGSIWVAVGVAVALSVLHFTSRNAIRSTAQPDAAPPVSAAVQNTAPATISIQASASPAEAKLYLDSELLPSNPYAGRMGADGMPHVIRAEAPGFASGTHAFVANREVAVILSLARTEEPSHGEAKKAHAVALPPSVAPVRAEPTTPTTTTPPQDDCKVSPYYIDSRNIKVVRPECLRAIQSP
jgi:hypothetical protein